LAKVLIVAIHKSISKTHLNNHSFSFEKLVSFGDKESDMASTEQKKG